MLSVLDELVAISAWRCSQASPSGPYIRATGSPRSSRWHMTAITCRLARYLLLFLPGIG